MITYTELKNNNILIWSRHRPEVALPEHGLDTIRLYFAVQYVYVPDKVSIKNTTWNFNSIICTLDYLVSKCDALTAAVNMSCQLN